MKELILTKNDIIIEDIQKGNSIDAIDELFSFWDEKVMPNLSKYYINKKVLQSIDEIEKKMKIIDEYRKKGKKDEKRNQMVNLHNEGKTKTTYKRQVTGSANSNLLFHDLDVSESFKNILKETNEEENNREIKTESLESASFIYKKEELDKNIISVTKNKKAIIGYIDFDLLLQRIAMETPIYHDEELNDFLLEGICLQYPNFIKFDNLIAKIISCFHFNYSRYLKNEKENNEEEGERTDNFSINYENVKKRKRIYIGSKETIERKNTSIEIFQDSENRIPYGIVNLIIIYIDIYRKFPLSKLDIRLDWSSKILDLLKYALDIYEVKNIYATQIIKATSYYKEIIESTIKIPKPKEKIPFEKICPIKIKNESFFEIFNYNSKDIAVEITRVTYDIFSKIRPNEFFKGLFTKKDKEKTSPNICKAVERFNSISYWVIEEVLSYDYSTDRAKVIDKFIHIAHELSLLNNFNDCMSIVSALGQMILTRLTKTWKKISSKDMTLFRKIKKILNFQNNYKNIRDEVAKCIKEGKPFLPFLGYYTKRICFIEEAGPYKNKTGLINVNKISQVQQVLSEFYEKDKVQYTFDIKDDIKNKLVILQFLDPSTEEELEKEGNLIEPNFILFKKTKNKRITYTERRFEENYKKKNVI